MFNKSLIAMAYTAILTKSAKDSYTEEEINECINDVKEKLNTESGKLRVITNLAYEGFCVSDMETKDEVINLIMEIVEVK